MSQQSVDLGAKLRLSAAGGVKEGAAVFSRQVGRLREQDPHTLEFLLIHGTFKRLWARDSLTNQGARSPSRSASQARANLQSRVTVLIDTPMISAVSWMESPV